MFVMSDVALNFNGYRNLWEDAVGVRKMLNLFAQRSEKKRMLETIKMP